MVLLCSEYRLGWTTESLNFTLPLQKSIRNLWISHYTRTTMHVKGSLPDVTKLVDHIKEKNRINNSELTKTKNFNTTFWYTYPPQKHEIVRPSDSIKEAYNTWWLVSLSSEIYFWRSRWFHIFRWWKWSTLWGFRQFIPWIIQHILQMY